MKVYATEAQAQSRLRKLARDGRTNLSVERAGRGFYVAGDPGTVQTAPDGFGLLMEHSSVVEAALDVDPRAINQWDTGCTHARPASELLRKLALQAGV